ncbi:DMT family transporter [Pelobacter seleniigenes]|uniref:DMT family transporter n=1 Tax=Pelobacter seleniigenes TaxID=407188 RepID=UPI0004A74655|nr:EamA family transporter [Pelobacter seleniigenes]
MLSRSSFQSSAAGIFAVALSAMLWGTVGVATQTIYRQSDLSAVSVGFYRLACGFPFVAALCWKIVGKDCRLPVRHYLQMGLVGILLALYQVFFFAAISQIGVAVATLITLCTAPVLVAVISVVVLRERLTGATLLSLSAAVVGIVLLVGRPGNVPIQGSLPLGVVLSLGSATGYAIVTISGRHIARSCHALLSTTVAFGSGALLLLPFAAANLAAVTYTTRIWEVICYIGLVPTAVAYLLFFTGMRSIRAASASILTLLEPLTATILSWFMFGERLAPTGILGGLFLLAAMVILYYGEKHLLQNG